jgi:hypothetical protein
LGGVYAGAIRAVTETAEQKLLPVPAKAPFFGAAILEISKELLSRLAPGDIVYLEKKAKKGDKSLRGVPHVVQPGESIYDIAQHYAIRLDRLYKLNGLSPDYVAKAGDLIWLR